MLRAKLKHRGVNNIFYMHALEYTETAAVLVVVSPPTENVKSSIGLTPTAFPVSFCLG